MQIVSVSGAVDEEQGIRNDGIKSSRSHRALVTWYSGGIQLIAGKKSANFLPFNFQSLKW
jgi:hypothetical protein